MAGDEANHDLERRLHLAETRTAELQAVEHALRESEAKYRTLFETMGQGFAVADLVRDASGRAVNYRLLELNPATERLLGVSVEKVLGKLVLDIFPDIEPEWIEAFDRVVHTGKSERIEGYFGSVDQWMEVQVYPWSGDRFITLYADITERKHRERNAALLDEIGKDLSVLTSPDEIIQTVGSRLGEFLRASGCIFADVDEDRNESTIHHGWNTADVSSLKQTFRLGDYFGEEFRRAGRAGEAVTVCDTANDARADAEAYARLQLGAFVTVPFQRQGRWVANITVTTREPRNWRSDEIELVQEIASRVFPRIERARAEAALRESEERQAFLLALSDALRPLADPAEIQRVACRVLGEHTGVSRVLYSDVYDEKEVVITNNYVSGVSPIDVRLNAEEFGRDLIATYKRGERVVFSDVANDSQFTESERRHFAALNIAANASVGLIKGGKWVAAFGMHNATPREWTPLELSLVEEVAERTWSTVERARSETALRASEERQAFLLRLSDALRSLTDFLEIQETATRLLGEHLGVRAVNYGLIETVGGVDYYVIDRAYVAPGRRSTLGRWPFADFPGVTAKLRAGETMAVDEVAIAPDLMPRDKAGLASNDVAAYMLAPLVKNKRLTAMLGVVEANPRAWTKAETELVQEVAERTWSAVERSRSEAALRESEQNLHGVANVVPDLLWYSAPDGSTPWYNDRWSEYTGQTAEQASGWGWADPIHPDDREESARRYREAVEQSKPHEREHRIRNAAGIYRWFLVRAEPLREADGRVTRMYGAATDIHDQRLAIEALRESEERQAFLLRLSDALRPVSDAVEIQAVTSRYIGEYLRVLRAGCGEIEGDELFVRADHTNGVSSMIGQYPIDAFGPSLTKVYREGGMIVVRDAATDSGLTEGEREQLRAVRVDAHVTVTIRKPGQQTISLGVHSDAPRDWKDNEISLVQEVAERTWAAVARVRVEQDRREIEERFRLYVANVREYALVQTDLEGIVTSWNPGAERLFGYTSAEVLDHPFVMLLPEEDRNQGIIAREMAQLSEGRKSVDAHAVQRKDGSRFWAEWVTEPVFDDAGELRGTAKVLRDETERQAAESVIRSSLAEKEELLKEVHHRVKNNLQVIVSLLNMQGNQIKDQDALAHFQEARNRVLAISSIHEQLYQAESFAGILLTDYARQLVPGLVRFYGLEARVDVHVLGDGNKLGLERAVPFGILLNELVSNACKHAFPEPTKGTLTIEVRPEGADLALIVSDDGKGLPEGFDYRKSSSLGLKLVHALARQLQGTVLVSTNLGTTVTVRFPVIALAGIR